MKKLFIDLRMMHSSGIGTYIRNIVPGIVSSCKYIDFQFLIRKQDFENCPWAKSTAGRVTISSAPIYSLSEQLDFIKSISKKTDLVWIPHYNIPFFYQGRLLVTVHDIFHLAMPQHVKGFHKKIYAKLMFEAVARHADIIICASRFTGDELLRLTTVDKNKIRIIPHGVAECPGEHRDDLAPHSKPYILFVGNIKPNKNLVRLMDAFAKIMSKVTHDLVIVGKQEGFITGDAAVKTKAAKLEDRVIFTGPVGDDILRRYYRHADVFVFPSLYEGFGFPPLEAMKCGCPVVASDAGSLREVCGEAAYYIDPFDIDDLSRGLLGVLTDEAMKTRLRARGLERVKSFTWDASITAHAAIFSELLEL